MPELPEVETVRNSLKKLVLNKTIENVVVLDKRIPMNSPLDLSNLNNQTIKDIHRLGKYLFFEFNDYILISHLRMEGKYYFYNKEEEISKHSRIVFNFNDGYKLVYDDVRRFGTMELYNKSDIRNSKTVLSIGKEPFTHTVETLYPLAKKSTLVIKNFLLDQHIISGIGNIYADEILYACNISPFIKANTLSKEHINKIINSSREILTDAINQGGSTIKSYHPGRDIDGKFQQKLLAYGKEGEHCKKCNSLFLKTFLNGRGTTYCPTCQKVCKIIGIYGKIASGKSTLLKMFKDDNYKVFSADEEVNSIYKNDLSFIGYCIHHFGEQVLDENNKVSKEYVKQIILDNPNNKKILEDYIHPEIKKRALKFINDNRNERLIILEIPLLFEAKMDKMCDYIIGLDISIDNQIRNLKNRKSKSVSKDLLLNSTNKFDKVKNRIDYIIENNYSLDVLYSQYKNVINELLNI